MNATEAIALCRYVKAACPQQAIDEYTPQAWADLLEDIQFNDAQTVTKALAKHQPFISPAEIITQVKKLHNERIARAGELTPPAGLTQPYERLWLRDVRKQIAQGIPTNKAIAQTNHDIGIQDGIHDREITTT